MRQPKELRYFLYTYFDREEQSTDKYKLIQAQIERAGCYEIRNSNDASDIVKIYNASLAIILTTKEIPAKIGGTNQQTIVNGFDFYFTFQKAYKEGEMYFEKEFEISPDTMYGTNAQLYVNNIHLNYFHVQHTELIEGWSSVKNRCPFFLTHEAIKEIGYYSGIVNKVEEQVKKHHTLFATFDKCEHNTPPPPINSETDTEKYAAKHYVLAYLFECNAKGESYPIGNKKELERIGNERMGAGKGNRFYKVFNEIINKDLNAENNLIEIGGKYWRNAVIELTKAPELVKNYLESKQL
jgi:hypothetical protein